MSIETNIPFSSLGLIEPLQKALVAKGYTHATPIQGEAIPHLLQGRDLIGLAQTGTGKTAAFALPLLQNLIRTPQPRTARRPRALILSPTRELASQIGESLKQYGQHLALRSTVIFGGVGEQPQIRALASGVDIVVATPGRLLDLMSQGHAFLERIECFVLDEADRMLDMGFAPDVKRIVGKLPARRHSLLFSATMPESIQALASSLLRDPVRVEVAPVGSTADRIEQSVCHVDRADKPRLLTHLLRQHPGERALVFTRTKHGANKVARLLERDGIGADAIHGNKSQSARQRALEGFRSGEVPVLVATDIAARGIDVKDVSLVVNYDLPEEPEAYVHRIGRTARAGASGLAVAFCDPDERNLLRQIQKLIRASLREDRTHPFAPNQATTIPVVPATQRHPETRHPARNRPIARQGQRGRETQAGRTHHRSATPETRNEGPGRDNQQEPGPGTKRAGLLKWIFQTQKP